MKKLVFMVCSLALFTGCASTTQLSDENHQSINTIFINEEVVTPLTAYYYGPEQGAGAVFGAIGAVIAQAADTKGDLIASYMQENGIDIGEICKNAVKNMLLNDEKFADKQVVSDAQQADTFLTVEVAVYGLSQTHGFSSVYRPQLGFKARLTDKNDSVLWEDYEYVTAMNKQVDAIEFKEYFEDPNNMQVRYEKAAEVVVSLMTEDF